MLEPAVRDVLLEAFRRGGLVGEQDEPALARAAAG
jgi:hypothetical protein